MGAAYTVGVILAIIVMIIAAGSSVAVVMGLIVAARHVVFALRGEPYQPLLQGGKKRAARRLQQATAAPTSDSTRAALRAFASTDVVNTYAQAALGALDSCERKEAAFYSVLGAKFAEGSLSWQKFASAATGVHDAVVSNCMKLANNIATFDVVDYRANERVFRPQLFRRNAMPTATDREKRDLYQARLSEMSAHLTANDRLLLELDKLTYALSHLDDLGGQSESERLVEEIRTLIDETKYYSQ